MDIVGLVKLGVDAYNKYEKGRRRREAAKPKPLPDPERFDDLKSANPPDHQPD